MVLAPKHVVVCGSEDDFEVLPSHGWVKHPEHMLEKETFPDKDFLSYKSFQDLGHWQNRESFFQPPYREGNVLRERSSICEYCSTIVEKLPLVAEPICSVTIIDSPDVRAGAPKRIILNPREPLKFKHYSNSDELAKSASRGCGICAQFMASRHTWTTLWPKSHAAEFTLGQSIAFLNYGFQVWDIELCIPVNVEKREDTGVPEILTSQSCMSYKICLRHAPTQAVLYDSTDGCLSTKDALPLVKEWFKFCSVSHEKCNRPKQIQRNPSRLVDITHDDLRLRLGMELEPNVRYATLSHCWGSGPFTHLTKADFDTFFRTIPATALGTTFNDSIEIARYLGLRYIWIDSLCIIQDDESDWQSESAMMASVYGNSIINLAASAAEKGNGGCFFDRGSIWRVQIQAKFQTQSHLFDCYPENLFSTERLLGGPLLSRGWALQERLLPRRTVHFAKDEILWECQETDACETFPYGCPRKEQDLFHLPKELTKDSWPHFVAIYSKCNLTLAGDKLVAISGLAQIISKNDGDHYLAGLWRTGMEMQLLWTTDCISAGLRPRPGIYRGPSWSWVSTDSMISMFNAEPGGKNCFKVLVAITDVEVRSCNSKNPFGEVECGTLRLKCSTFYRVQLQQLVASNVYFKSMSGSLAAMVFWDCVDEFLEFNHGKAGTPRHHMYIDCMDKIAKFRENPSKTNLEAYQKSVAIFEFNNNQYGTEPAGWDFSQGVDVFLLPVLSWKEGQRLANTGCLAATDCLLLRKVEGTGRYARIGQVNLYLWGSDDIDAFLHHQAVVASAYAEVCMDNTGKEQLFIDLV